MLAKRTNWFSTEKITYVALLVALQVVLGNVTQIPFIGKQFTFGFLPIAAAGALLGPVAAVVVGALGDFFGAHLFPQGAYFVGFTVTNIVVGVVYGLLLHAKKPSWARAVIATAAVALINLFLNSFWLSLLYATRAFWGWVSVRAATYLIEAPVQAVLTYFTLRGLQKLKLPFNLRLVAEEPEKESACESAKKPSSRG
ncbi:MAG: folate family ECF transporter S component [Clostridia bacterium]